MQPRTVISKLVAVVALLLCGVSFSAQAQDLPTYQNEAMGITLTCPEGWFLVSGDKVQQALNKNISDMSTVESVKEAYKKLGILVVFSKYPFGSPREFNPNMALTSEQIDPQYAELVKAPLDIANAGIVSMKVMFKDAQVVEQPSLVSVAGRECAHYVYEATSVRGYLEQRLKCSIYIFVKDGIVYTLSFTDSVADFDADLAAFQYSVNSIKFQ